MYEADIARLRTTKTEQMTENAQNMEESQKRFRRLFFSPGQMLLQPARAVVRVVRQEHRRRDAGTVVQSCPPYPSRFTGVQ
jgi:hypothetical protein